MIYKLIFGILFVGYFQISEPIFTRYNLDKIVLQNSNNSGKSNLFADSVIDVSFDLYMKDTFLTVISEVYNTKISYPVHIVGDTLRVYDLMRFIDFIPNGDSIITGLGKFPSTKVITKDRDVVFNETPNWFLLIEEISDSSIVLISNFPKSELYKLFLYPRNFVKCDSNIVNKLYFRKDSSLSN